MTSPLHPAETHLIERRARATGTRVALVYSYEADPEQPWETICYGTDDDHPHGGVASHETRALAEVHLSHPDEWCEYCMGNLACEPDCILPPGHDGDCADDPPLSDPRPDPRTHPEFWRE